MLQLGCPPTFTMHNLVDLVQTTTSGPQMLFIRVYIVMFVGLEVTSVHISTTYTGC